MRTVADFQKWFFGCFAASWPPAPPRKAKIAKRALAPESFFLLELLLANTFLEALRPPGRLRIPGRAEFANFEGRPEAQKHGGTMVKMRIR